jgi:DNA repair protein RecN (Recombination protein N)
VLTSLRVRDLAVLEDVEVAFGEGLTVLTGETGAGKSLVVDALLLLAGGRADPALVRAGAERLVVEAVFDCDDAEVRAALAEAGLVEDGKGSFEVVVRREVAAAGAAAKGRLLVNGSPAPLKALQEAAARLLVLYGQAEARELLDPAAPRELLDRFAGLDETAAGVAALHRELVARQRDLARLAEAGKDRVQRLELLEFQLAEIDKVDPKEGEDDEISSERKRLGSVEKTGQALAQAVAALEDDESGALRAAGAARAALLSLEEISPSYVARAAMLAEAIERLREVGFETSRDLAQLEADPARLAFIAERLDALAKLKRKYGATLAEVIERRTALGREREELADLEGAVKKAEGAVQKAFAAFRKAALELSQGRAAAAPRLGKAVEAHLTDLALRRASFAVEVARKPDPASAFTAGGESVAFGPHGVDTVSFAFAPNPGEPPRPLPKIASGGELSRVQLALAAALAEEESGARSGGGARRGGPVRTFVFDEVDAGVSGATAEAVGRKLRALAAREQILVVTHLPQVAASGTHHLAVEKVAAAGRTRTRVTALDAKGRVEAVAALLAGASVGEPARAQARQLLDGASRGVSKAR